MTEGRQGESFPALWRPGTRAPQRAPDLEAATKIYRGFEIYHGFNEFGGASDYSVRELITAIVRVLSLPRQSDSAEEIIDLGRTLMEIERPVTDFFGR